MAVEHCNNDGEIMAQRNFEWPKQAEALFTLVSIKRRQWNNNCKTLQKRKKEAEKVKRESNRKSNTMESALMFGQSQFPVLLALSSERRRLKYINTHLWKMSVMSVSGITKFSSFLHNNAALYLQRWFSNSPPMVIRISATRKNCWVIHTESRHCGS